MAFEHRITVRFQDVDRAGIAFFGCVFSYCHEAYEELLNAIGYPLVDIFDAEGWGMPLVHAKSDFVAPMRMGEVLSITIHVARLGDSSITLRFEVSGAVDGRRRAEVEHVHACIDLATFQKRAIPERLREAFAKLA